MIGGMTNAPFSRYNKVARKPKPTLGGNRFQNPELDGMKHAGNPTVRGTATRQQYDEALASGEGARVSIGQPGGLRQISGGGIPRGQDPFNMQPPPNRFPGQSGGTAADRQVGMRTGKFGEPIMTGQDPNATTDPARKADAIQRGNEIASTLAPPGGNMPVGSGSGYRAMQPGEDPEAYQKEMAGVGQLGGDDQALPQGGEPQEQLDATIGGGYSNETAPEWGTEDYQQGMYNLAREQISGQTAADTEYARTQLGGKGLRAGESGIANKALMNIRREGSERLGTESRKMAMQGMGAKYGQQQDLMNMIMQKYGMDIGAQQRRFDPYYQTEQQYAGIA